MRLRELMMCTACRRLDQSVLLEVVVARSRCLLILLVPSSRDFSLVLRRLLVAIGLHHVGRGRDVVHLIEAGPLANLSRAEPLG